MKRQILRQEICEYLTQWQYKIEIMNKQAYYDIDLDAQDIICRIYNVLFDYKLKNLNKEKANFEAIDLADESKKVAIQVTAENTSTKIKNTINAFNKNKHYEKYNRLIFAILGNKKKYTTTFDTEGFFAFDPKTDIIDFKQLSSEIFISDLRIQEIILNILKEEMSDDKTEEDLILSDSIQIIEKKVFARCCSKLISIGLNKEQATNIINDDINSDRYADILDAEQQGKIYLQGEFGSGKSHAIFILILRMIRDYIADNSKPFPLYINAREISKTETIQALVEKQTKANEYYVFVDGCDEMSLDEAKDIVNEVQYLRLLRSKDHFLLCGRPLFFIDNNFTYNMLCLSEDRVFELIAIISEKEKSYVHSQMYSLEKGVKETLRRPLYTLLYAILMKQSKSFFRISYSDLITNFVNWTLNKCGGNREIIFSALEHLSILAIDRNMGKIHLSELRGIDVYTTLQKTGFLFLHNDNTISFMLPVIAQWFAAQSILHKIISIDDILQDKTRSSRWRYALSIMFSQMTFDDSIELFSKIVKKDAGLVPDIILNGTKDEYMNDSPSSFECGKRIYQCMLIWGDALGELKNELSFFYNGRLKKLAIHMLEGTVTTVWSNEIKENDVCVLSPNEQRRYGRNKNYQAHSQSTWPWIYTFEMIRREINNLIKHKKLMCNNIDIQKEFVWKTTLELTNKGNLYQDAISLIEVEKYREFRDGLIVIRKKAYDLNYYFSLIDSLYNSGVYYISPNIPIGDKDFTGLVWSNYSEHRMYERVIAIYQKALEAYDDYVDNWFSAFASRMTMAILMPGTFHANLQFKESSDIGPILSYHFEAKPIGTKNNVNITLNEINEWEKKDNQIQTVYEKDTAHRADKREWIHWWFRSEAIRCYEASPITDVVFQWLRNDLKDIGWVE